MFQIDFILDTRQKQFFEMYCLGSYWRQVNIGSGDGLVSQDNKPSIFAKIIDEL